MADEIIEEVWRIKDEIAREHGYDIDRLAAYFRRRERERAREQGDAPDREETAGQTASEETGVPETDSVERVSGTVRRRGM